jgi:hypothetical protein
LRVLVVWPDSSSYFYEDVYPGYGEQLNDIKAICRGDVDPRAILAHTCILNDLPASVSEHLTMHNFSDIQDDWAGLSTGEDFWTKAEERIQERRLSFASGKFVLEAPFQDHGPNLSITPSLTVLFKVNPQESLRQEVSSH